LALAGRKLEHLVDVVGEMTIRKLHAHAKNILKDGVTPSASSGASVDVVQAA
jgi:hypothetical protein